MECLDFDGMSSLDLIAGMGINPGCTPIKSSQCANGDEVYEDDEITLSPCLLKRTASHAAFSSPPSILRRGKYKRNRRTSNQEEHHVFLLERTAELSDVASHVDQLSITRLCPAQPLQTTPVRLTYENLPFSPSQFMNSLCQSSSSDYSSTPEVSQSSYYCASINGSEPHTPTHQVARQSFSPHTPTPFKHAMAEVERRAQSKPWTPGDLDDLGKVLKECDTVYEADHTGYEADHSAGFTPLSQALQSKRRFSREPTNQPHEKVQKKSAKKIVFTDSPPKEIAKTIMLDPCYEKVACGLTKDQMDMTQLAKYYL